MKEENNKRRALGMGLEQLFNSEMLDLDQVEEKIVEETPKDEIVEVNLSELMSNPYQPRKVFDEDALKELSESIKEHGVFQPIIVKKSVKGYNIIAGERRAKASKLAGLTKVPAIIRDFTDEEMMQVALLENLQRENLNPIDEAQAYKNLMKLNDLTQTALAKEMGKSQSYVANKLRLLKLTPKVQASLIDGNISARHGRALVGLDEKTQEKVLNEVLAKGLNVKETEAIVKDVDGYFNPKTKKAKKQGKSESKKRVVNKMPKDLKVQINTIKRAVKLAEESGIEVKVKENNNPDDYRITIEMKRK